MNAKDSFCRSYLFIPVVNVFVHILHRKKRSGLFEKPSLSRAYKWVIAMGMRTENFLFEFVFRSFVIPSRKIQFSQKINKKLFSLRLYEKTLSPVSTVPLRPPPTTHFHFCLLPVFNVVKREEKFILLSADGAFSLRENWKSLKFPFFCTNWFFLGWSRFKRGMGIKKKTSSSPLGWSLS